MNLTTQRAHIGFWDAFAPWYEKWLSRTAYHHPIVHEISGMLEPGWSVLDIGAGTGVLSLPLTALGCTVEAVEPSEGMRRIFTEKLNSLRVTGVDISPERWETYRRSEGKAPDLIVACNSLHLVDGGIMAAMEKVFAQGAGNLCLVTEINLDRFVDFKEIGRLQRDYDFLYIKNFTVDSTFYFDSMDEVPDLSDLLGRNIDVVTTRNAVFERDSTDIALLWWERRT